MPLPIGPLPYILTNGTLADANQVMADFNTLLNGINGLAPLSTAIVGQTSNVRASLAAAGTTITVTADSVTVGTALNGTSYTLTSYSQSFNGATVGAGGMDAGALPTSGYVALYAIYNPTAPAISILGTNASSAVPPVYGAGNMPAGFTASALLAIIPTNSTPAMVAGWTRGRFFQYAGQVLVLNSPTNQASLTSLSVSSAIPVSAQTITGGLFGFNTTTGATVVNATINISSGVSATYVTAILIAAGVATFYTASFGTLMVPTPQTMFYSTGSVSAAVSAVIQINGYGF